MNAAFTTRSALSLVALAMLAGTGCSRDNSVSESGLGEETIAITITTPPDVPVTAVAVGANGRASLGRGARIRATGAAVPVATNMGSNAFSVGEDSIVGDLWSASRVELGSRTRVTGSVHAAELTLANDVEMAGKPDAAPKLSPPRTLSWKVSYAPTSRPPVSVDSGAEQSVPPDQYVALRATSGSTLRMNSGTYLLDSLIVDSGAHVRLDTAGGPVVIYVRATLRLDGTIEGEAGASPDLLVAYVGTADLTIQQPFAGTLVAARSKVSVASPDPGLSGALFAPDVEIGDGVTVTFGPPNAILKAAAVPLGDCLATMLPNGGGSDRQAEVQYQQQILRYCTGTDLGGCESALLARANADFFAAAQAVLHGTISPAQYTALIRDREKKLALARADEQMACAIIADDSDGDFVPASSDACPATPDLTPTLDNGCTDVNLPLAPSTANLQKALGTMGVSGDPRCAGAPTPTVPAPLGAWRNPRDPSVGKALWVSRQADPSGCPIYFQVEGDLTDGDTRHIGIKPTEDTNLGWIAKPANAVQLNLKASDGGDRAAWASYAVYTVRYRARAVSGSGRRSEWSEWFRPGREDCVAGSPCAD